MLGGVLFYQQPSGVCVFVCEDIEVFWLYEYSDWVYHSWLSVCKVIEVVLVEEHGTGDVFSGDDLFFAFVSEDNVVGDGDLGSERHIGNHVEGAAPLVVAVRGVWGVRGISGVEGDRSRTVRDCER